MFGGQASSPLFGTPSTTPSLFGTPSSTPAFATPATTPAFGGGATSTPAFGSGTTGFGGSSLFSTPFSAQPQQQQQQTPLFQQPSTGGGFGFQTPAQNAPAATPFQTPFATTTPFPNPQLTTQMAPVAPIPFSLADRDIQAIVDAYKEDPGNPKYAFKQLLFSIIEPPFRVKPAGVSDIMWAEAMGKLEGMENRDELWPQLVQGFKDLSTRLKFQDEAIVLYAERLRQNQSNVKQVQRTFQADTLPRIELMRQRQQSLQRRLLRLMRIVEALEGKGCRLPLMKGEVDIADKLKAITRQLKGSGAELSRKVQHLLNEARVQANASGGCHLPGTKIDEQSLCYLQDVLQQQTEAIARLGNVLKRDTRDMDIIMAEDTQMAEGTC